jgi:zinc protease
MVIRVVALLCISCLSAATSARAEPPTTATSGVELNYTKYTLKNGLDVILHEDHRLPLVAVNIWYHVGPANETAGRTGFAHLFEHMMFEGSKHIGSKAHFRYLERAGASDINGTTDFDRTNYFETLPSNQLELALWLESDRMGYLLDGLDAEKLTNQRDVVRNERRQSTEGTPYGLVEEEICHQLLPKSHPYYACVIGSHADIEAARLDDVREFSRQYYTPTNASLAIAGDIDPARTRELVERYFGSIPAGPRVAVPSVATPAITAERRAVVTDQIELSRIYMAWITAPIYQPGDAEADLIAQVLGGGRSGRLYKRLVQQLQLAQDVKVETQNLQFGSALQLRVTAKPGVALERLEHEIDAELERLRRDGPTAAELVRARNQIETRMLTRLELLGGFGGVADQLNRYNQFLHDPGYLARDLARYDTATVASVRQVAASRLQREARVVIYGVPGKKQLDDPPRAAASVAATPAPSREAMAGRMADEPWRAAAPASGPAPGIRLPTPARFALENGLNVFVVEQHGLPVVAASVVALAGTGANPVELPGLSAFTAAMLQEGTRARTAAQVADDAAQAGSELATRSERDAAVATLTVLKSNTGAALGLLADVVEHPRLAGGDVERVRRLRDGELQQSRSNPYEVSRQLLLGAIYGPKHAYGYPDLGTQVANGKITAAEINSFWQTHYRPATTALVLAGDVTAEEARALASQYFGGWRVQGTPTAAGAKPVAFEPAVRILLLDRPDAPQSMVRAGLPGVARATKDYVPLEVMNNVLGGLFSSRLNMNLREEHGYTYGTYSAFRDARAPGYFTCAAAIRTDATAPAIKEMLSELGRIHTVPPTADELKLAQAAFAQSLAGLFETSEVSTKTVADLFVYDLPMEYYATLPAQAYEVTAAQVTALADRYLDLASLKVVVVGDRKKVETGIRALGAGSVELIADEDMHVP